MTTAFAVLAAIVLAVSAFALRGLGAEHEVFTSYVLETAARMRLASEVLDAANARAISARTLVLVVTPADRDLEKAEVTRAHKEVGEAMEKLRAALATGSDVDEKERKLFADLQSVESQYGPVALRIVGLALEDKREEAIAMMNEDCRPLLASLVKSAGDYIAYSSSVADEDVKTADSAAARNLAWMIAPAWPPSPWLAGWRW